jgi:hypothetical protein
VSDTCAGRARAHHEPRAGTASPAVGWLLVEQPGAWGRDALTASGLDPAIGAGLAAAAADLAVRVQTIRRPGGSASTSSPRTVVLAHAGPSPWVEVLHLADDEALLDLDPAVCLEPDPPGLGVGPENPLYLVCTHAKRDRCCATWGRPIADTLAALHPDAAWEASHIGGHRFAGNLVVLPEGLVYGGLDVASAVRAVDLYGAGRLDLDLLRGRAALPRPAQAAEILLRRDLDVDRIDAVEDVTVVDGDDGADGVATVELTVADRGRWRAQVAKRPLGASYASSCDSDELEDPGRYELVDRRQVAAT